MHFIGHFIRKKAIFLACLGVFFVMAVAGSSLVRAADAAAKPAQTEAAAPGKEDFGQYLIDHQDDLAPFFQKHGDDLVKQGMGKLLQVAGMILLLNVVMGWVLDIGIGYGFSSLFAKALKAKTRKALIFATGGLVIIMVLAGILGLIAFLASQVSPLLALLVIGLLPVAEIIIQTIWVMYLYRTNLVVSGLFCFAVLLVHVLAGSVLSGSMVASRGIATMTQYIDQNVTPELKSAAAESKQEAATAEAARDKVQADVSAVRDRLSQAAAQADTLKQEIEAKKNSDAFIYGRISRTHAQGDLIAARDQLNVFLARFPSSSLTDAAKAQLAMVESELAAQEAQKKQAEADAAQAAAKAQADFLARASKDGVTLSEARQVVLGKTREEVTALFGAPTETGSDRWGYGRVITVNPLTGEKYGLSIYFSVGAVQGVDYYYGGGGAK